jgi:hypothetical protein
MADDSAYLRNLKALTRSEPQFAHLGRPGLASLHPFPPVKALKVMRV